MRNKQGMDSIAKNHPNQPEYELQTHSTLSLIVVMMKKL